MSVLKSLKRAAVASFLTAALLITPSAAQAIEISDYDRLSTADQSRYLVTLLDGSKRLLQSQGRHDMAAKIITEFDTIQPGDSVPRGLYQLHQDIQTARQLTRETGKKFHVEHALLVTFKQFGIEVPKAEVMTLAANFEAAENLVARNKTGGGTQSPLAPRQQ